VLWRGSVSDMLHLRVVVVDQNPRFCEQLATAFAEAGIQVQSFLNGTAAQEAIVRKPPALWVVDLSHPSAEGQWLLAQLCGKGAVEAPLGVIALVNVTDDLSTLPEHVEVLARPVFPAQVVASAQRLFPVGIPRSGRQATLRGLPSISGAVHAVPPQSGGMPGAPHSLSEIEEKPSLHFDRRSESVPGLPKDESDFAAGVTVLAQESTSALVRDMMRATDDEEAVLRSSDLLPFHDDDDDDDDEPTRPRAPKARLRDPSPPVEVLSGELSALTMMEVLDLLVRRQLSGVLIVSLPPKTLRIYLQKGWIAQATGDGFPGLRLGRFLMDLDPPLRAPEIEAVAATPIDGTARHEDPTLAPPTEMVWPIEPAPEALLGQRLVRAGLLKKQDLCAALAEQSTELILEGMSMVSGRFSFAQTDDLPDTVLRAELGGALLLDPAELLLRAQKRNEDWRNFEKDLAEGAVYVSDVPPSVSKDLTQLGLSHTEQRVLALCTGRLSVADLARETCLPLGDVSRTLSRLVALRVVRRRLPALLAL